MAKYSIITFKNEDEWLEAILILDALNFRWASNLKLIGNIHYYREGHLSAGLDFTDPHRCRCMCNGMPLNRCKTYEWSKFGDYFRFYLNEKK